MTTEEEAVVFFEPERVSTMRVRLPRTGAEPMTTTPRPEGTRTRAERPVVTRETVDAAWDRLSEDCEERELAYATDLITISHGLAGLRARVARLEAALAAIEDTCNARSSSGLYTDGLLTVWGQAADALRETTAQP